MLKKYDISQHVLLIKSTDHANKQTANFNDRTLNDSTMGEAIISNLSILAYIIVVEDFLVISSSWS